VRDADRRHLGDGGVLVEGVFDLDGIDVLAAADDDVLRPVDDVDEVLIVETRHVAVCSQPRVKTLAVSSGRFQ